MALLRQKREYTSLLVVLDVFDEEGFLGKQWGDLGVVRLRRPHMGETFSNRLTATNDVLGIEHLDHSIDVDKFLRGYPRSVD